MQFIQRDSGRGTLSPAGAVAKFAGSQSHVQLLSVTMHDGR